MTPADFALYEAMLAARAAVDNYFATKLLPESVMLDLAPGDVLKTADGSFLLITSFEGEVADRFVTEGYFLKEEHGEDGALRWVDATPYVRVSVIGETRRPQGIRHAWRQNGNFHPIEEVTGKIRDILIDAVAYSRVFHSNRKSRIMVVTSDAVPVDETARRVIFPEWVVERMTGLVR
jgi:hypothetical protein